MREIIFRGKSLVTKEWVYGDLFQHGEQRFIMAGGHNVEVDSESVGQYMGCDDENDVKIFEGDICHFYGGDYYSGSWEENHVCEISFCAVCLHYLENAEFKEVIGNAYNNSELIEDGDDDE